MTAGCCPKRYSPGRLARAPVARMVTPWRNLPVEHLGTDLESGLEHARHAAVVDNDGVGQHLDALVTLRSLATSSGM